MTDRNLIFREVTISRRLRDRLEEAACVIDDREPIFDAEAVLLAEDIRAVVRRWDENDVSETTIEEPIASRRA